MMKARKFDGQVRKMQSASDLRSFFDFEFFGESDVDTYGLLCLTRISEPTHLFITEMVPDEFQIKEASALLDAVKTRVAQETKFDDLVFPKLIRFEQKKNTSIGFQEFLKTYAAPIAVYENIFDASKEAHQVEKLSVDQFKNQGGKISIVGKLSM